MEGRSIFAIGLPRSISNVKLKLRIEKLIDGRDCIESVKRSEDRVIFTFSGQEGYEKFMNTEIRQIEFGGKSYPIEYSTSEFPSVDRMSTPSPQPKKNKEVSTTEKLKSQIMQEIPKFGNDLQEKLYNCKHSWSSMERLPAAGGTMCLLAQNIDPSTSIQKVLLHFESKRRAGGGPVAGIVNMTDGLLIVFVNSNDCASCLEKSNQSFEDRTLQILPKLIPEYEDRKFVIEGVGPDTVKDTLVMFLENCTKDEIAPKSCVKQELPGVYLVEYDEDFDTTETEAFLQKIKSNALEGSQLQAKLLLKTDCLKVIGASKDVSNDQIKLVFKNRKRSGGGLVTRVDRLEKDSALVYFSFYEDAERVYKFSLEATILIGQHPAIVSLYYHSLATDHENVLQGFEPTSPRSVPTKDGQKQPLQPYEFESKYDEKLLDFVFGREKHLQILNEVFGKFAVIENIKPPEEDNPRRLRFTPKKVFSNKSQEEFEKTCETSFEKHVAKYSRVTQGFDPTKLEKTRSLRLYPHLEITYTGSESNNDLELSWKPDEPVVEAIGIKEVVSHMVQHITKCVNSSVVTRKFAESQFGVLLYCDIISDLREKYKDLQITWDNNDFSVTFIGHDSEISAAQLDALSAMMIEQKKLSGLDEKVLKFLSESMQKSGELIAKIQGKLKVNSVKALLLLDDDEPYLKAKTKENFKKAVEVIRQYITVDVIKTDDAKSNVIKSREWTDFRQSLKEDELSTVYVQPNESIILVGVVTETKIVRAKIKSFLDEHAIKRFFMNTEYGKARFVVERSKEFNKEVCQKREITCGISPKDNGGIVVEGKRRALDIAFPEMKKLLGSIIEEVLTLERPGIKEYYNSENGKQYLANTERACDCVILTEIRDNPEWVEYNKRHGFFSRPKSKSTPVDLQEKQLCAARLPNSSVMLSVWRTDISKHKCDVIVNASNEELKLLSQGVSGIIKDYDVKNGNQIQKEMDEYNKRNYGNMLPGDAVMTSAGNLPGCKRIVHACGPRWNSTIYGSANPHRILKACISRSLENMERDHLKSVAIPAISCGVFGGKVNVCIPLIVEATAEYFQDNKMSSIKEVHFVENSKQDILDKFVGTLQKYESSTGSVEPVMVGNTSKVMNTPAPYGLEVSSLPEGSCTVILIHGDIADQKADIIVNVTDPKNLTNMMNGPVISKVLGAKAGHSVQQEVSRLSGPHNIGCVFETSGGGLACQKLYHALVTHYNQSQAQASESLILTVVTTSLDMADKSGFKSIVFPAIATGGFRYPPDIVAKLMRQAISNFNGNSVREVIILLHPQNPTAIQAFDAEFKSGSPVNSFMSVPAEKRINFTPSCYSDDTLPALMREPIQLKARLRKSTGKSTFDKTDDYSASFGKVKASIQSGDITDHDCDVIVNSTNSDFDLSKGMVSKQILRKGGRIIQDEATESGGRKTKDRDFVVTSSGKLKCRKIIHLVTPNDPKDLQKKIIKVLNEVERLQLNEVCMPAFGTGNLHMEVDEVGSVMQASIQQFVKSKRGLKFLKTVTIMIYDDSILENFKRGFFTPKKGFLERWFSWGGSLLEALTSSNEPGEEGQSSNLDDWEHLPQSPKSLNLFLYSTSEENIQQAKSFITDEIRKVVHRAVIEESSIGRLTDWERYDIVKSGEKHSVQITQSSSRYLDRLILEGLTKDVMKAQEEIKDVLREFESAETCVTYVTWQKMNARNLWEDYHIRSAMVLEKAYQERTKGSLDNSPTQIRVQEFSDQNVTEHTIDLSLLDGKQQGQPPKVRRRVKERSVADIPDYWDDMKGQQLILIPLQQSSQEYKNVSAQFMSGSLQNSLQNVVSIQRVQNVSLYKQYVAKKAEITEKLKSFNGQIERDLFHGSSDDDKIIQNGFDRSYAGKNNILYGRGVYFATDPGFSHSYASPDPQGRRRMLLANVLTGEFCVGNQNMVAPPTRTSSTIKNDLFDSTVNNATNPTIFVIYKDASAYPAYLLTYT